MIWMGKRDGGSPYLVCDRNRLGMRGLASARESLALLAGTEFVVLLTPTLIWHSPVRTAPRTTSAGAIDAALEAQRLATVKQDRATLRKIEAFLGAGG